MSGDSGRQISLLSRFFYIMGTIITLLSFWFYGQIIYLGAIERQLNETTRMLSLNLWLVTLSLGITQIAVGWLISKRSNTD